MASCQSCTLPSGAPITAATAAFAAAVREQLHQISCSLLTIEAAPGHRSDDSPPASDSSHGAAFAYSIPACGGDTTPQRRGLTLLGTQAAAQGVMRRLAFLSTVLERVVPDEPMGAAQASAWLLDQLAAMLSQRALLADPQGRSHFCPPSPELPSRFTPASAHTF